MPKTHPAPAATGRGLTEYAVLARPAGADPDRPAGRWREVGTVESFTPRAARRKALAEVPEVRALAAKRGGVEIRTVPARSWEGELATLRTTEASVAEWNGGAA